MENTNISTNTYQFEDISIQIVTQNETLLCYINEYCHLTPAKTVLPKKICFRYREKNQREFSGYDAVPEDAHLDLEVPFLMKDVSIMKCYSRSVDESWCIYEGFASEYINFRTKEVTLTLNHTIANLDLQSFILLFIHPLIKILRDFGFCRLHAACLNVRDRHILFSGLSGRGKSTATFALLQRGHQVLSDEMPLFKRIKGGFQIYSLFDIIKLRQLSLDKFFPDFDRVHFRAEDDCYIKLSDLNQVGLKKLNQVHYLFILEQTQKTTTRIEPTGCLNIVPEIIPTSLNILNRQHAHADFQYLMELLDTVECYKVFFGTDMGRFAEQIERLVVTGKVGHEASA